MKILDLEQGSIEWLAARLWRLTASDLKATITAKGALSKSETALKAVEKLIAGIDCANHLNDNFDELAELEEWELRKIISNYTGDKFKGSLHTERGHELEPAALAELSKVIRKPIEQVGMVVMGDDENGVVSCSPDGRINDERGEMVEGGEVKSVCLCTYNRYIKAGVLPAEHKLQVHAGLAVTGLDVWHFGAYFPGKPLFYVRVERDEFTETLQKSLEAFPALYEAEFRKTEAAIEALEKGGASE